MTRAVCRRGQFVRAVTWTVAALASVGSSVLFTFRVHPAVDFPEWTVAVREFPDEGVAAPPRVDVMWTWRQRAAEPAAGGKVRDLFTPPEGWRDASTGRWRRGRAPVASVAASAAEEGALSEAQAVRVIRIVRRSFPWQLVGFAESGGHLVGLFQEVSSGAMVWGRAGALLGDAAFRIESIRVVLSAGAAKAEGDVPERVARAVVVDSVAGVRHDLCTAERLGVGAPRAELRLVSTGRVLSLAAGESVSDGGATLAVTEIDPRRGRVVVRCLQTQTAVTAEGVLLHWARDGSDELERNGE